MVIGYPSFHGAGPVTWLAVGYEVHPDVFDGPFELLLRLIAEQRVDLYEVVLADIVDAFLAEVEAMQRLDLELATEFLVIAATLVELKCRRLLPGARRPTRSAWPCSKSATTCWRALSSHDVSAAGAELAHAEQAASRSWPRLAGLDERFEGLQPDLFAFLSPDDVRPRRPFVPSSRRPTPHVETDHVLVDEVTVAEVVEALCERLPERPATTFASSLLKPPPAWRSSCTSSACSSSTNRALSSSSR